MPSSSDFTVTSASGAGGSNRAASYACIAGLLNLHYKIGCIFRMSQLRRVNLGGGGRNLDACPFFDAEVNAGSLRKRERLKGSECALAENSINLTDHGVI